MKSFRRWMSLADNAGRSTTRSAAVFLRDVGHGLLEVSHNTLALLGLLVVIALAFTVSRDDVLHGAEAQALSWLQMRQELRSESPVVADVDPGEPDAVTRATAIDLGELSQQQAAVAQWISRRYRVALEPIGRLVHEAWLVGQRAGLDPTLILAIMAIESSFNPFAQSSVGAQGLMQVMTKVHDDKYVRFGGNHAAFDPVTNLRVGVQVLKECIKRAGSLEGGLRYYVGAANLPDDGGYADKVLAEQGAIQAVVRGIRGHTATLAASSAPASGATRSVNPPPTLPPLSTKPGEKIALLD